MGRALPAQGASSLGVVLVVVQAQQQLGQIGVDLMVPDAGEDFEEQRRLTPEALESERDGRRWRKEGGRRSFPGDEGGSNLDQEVQLSGPPLVQRRGALADQRAEVVAQLQDLVQAVEDLGREEPVGPGDGSEEEGGGPTGFRRMKDWASRLLRKWSWASRMLSKSLVELICWWS